MLPRTVINQTIERFPDYAGEDFEVSPLEKGGSERRFYRIQAGPGHSMIVVKYSSQKEENRHYVTIAQFLAGSGVSVPKIYFHDAEEGLIWMQDLGEVDLWASRQSPWEERRPQFKVCPPSSVPVPVLLAPRGHRGSAWTARTRGCSRLRWRCPARSVRLRRCTREVCPVRSSSG